jgi:hypothetical protein
MRTLMLTVASVFCLLGCTTSQEKALKQQAEMERMIAEYGPACTKLGYAMNSDLWRNCVVQLGARNGVNRGGVSTSVFGSWGSWGRSSGVGIGIGVGQ